MANILDKLNSPEYVEAYRNRTGRNAPVSTSAYKPEFDYEAFAGGAGVPTAEAPVASSDVSAFSTDPRVKELLKADESAWYDPRSWLATEEGVNDVIGRGSRAHIGAYDSPEIRKAKLQEVYGKGNVIDDPNDPDNYIIMGEDGPRRYNPRGLDLGDIASVALPEVLGGVGSILGAAGGATVAAPTGPGALAGALAGSGLGYAGGRTLGREAVSALYGDVDNADAGLFDNTSGFLGDAALGAIGEGAGRLIGRGATGAFNYLKNQATLKDIADASSNSLMRRIAGNPTASAIASKVPVIDVNAILARTPGLRVQLPTNLTDDSLARAFQGTIPEGDLTPIDAARARAAFSGINPEEQSLAHLVNPDDLAGIYASARQARGSSANLADEFTQSTEEAAENYIRRNLGLNDPSLVGSARTADAAEAINRNRLALKTARNRRADSIMRAANPPGSKMSLDEVGRAYEKGLTGLDIPTNIESDLPLYADIRSILESQAHMDDTGNLIRRAGEAPIPSAPRNTAANQQKAFAQQLGRAETDMVDPWEVFSRTRENIYTKAAGPNLEAQKALANAVLDTTPGYRSSQAASRPFRELMLDQEAAKAINRETGETTDAFLRPISDVLNGARVPDLDNVRTLAAAFDVNALSGQQVKELAEDMLSAIGNKMTTGERGIALQNLSQSEKRALSTLYTIANTDPSLYGRVLSTTGEILPNARRVKMKDWIKTQNLTPDIERSLGDIGGSTLLAHTARAKASRDATNKALQRLNIGSDVIERANRVGAVAGSDRGALAIEAAQNLGPAASVSGLLGAAATGSLSKSQGALQLALGNLIRYTGLPRLKSSIALTPSKRTTDAIAKAAAARMVKSRANQDVGANNLITRLLAPDTMAYRRSVADSLARRQTRLNDVERASAAAGLPSADITDLMPSMRQFYLPDYLRPSTSLRGAFSTPSRGDILYQSLVPAPIRGDLISERDDREPKGAFR